MDREESRLLYDLGFNAEHLKRDVHVFSSHFYTKPHEDRITKLQTTRVRLLSNKKDR